MDHPLLVLWSIKAQPTPVRKLDYSLAETRDIAMPKNSPDAFDELVLMSITLGILVRHELHQCLSNCKTDRFTHNSIILLIEDTRKNVPPQSVPRAISNSAFSSYGIPPTPSCPFPASIPPDKVMRINFDDIPKGILAIAKPVVLPDSPRIRRIS
jgi:hypothetical protein